MEDYHDLLDLLDAPENLFEKLEHETALKPIISNFIWPGPEPYPTVNWADINIENLKSAELFVDISKLKSWLGNVDKFDVEVADQILEIICKQHFKKNGELIEHVKSVFIEIDVIIAIKLENLTDCHQIFDFLRYLDKINRTFYHDNRDLIETGCKKIVSLSNDGILIEDFQLKADLFCLCCAYTTETDFIRLKPIILRFIQSHKAQLPHLKHLLDCLNSKTDGLTSQEKREISSSLKTLLKLTVASYKTKIDNMTKDIHAYVNSNLSPEQVDWSKDYSKLVIFKDKLKIGSEISPEREISDRTVFVTINSGMVGDLPVVIKNYRYTDNLNSNLYLKEIAILNYLYESNHDFLQLYHICYYNEPINGLLYKNLSIIMERCDTDLKQIISNPQDWLNTDLEIIEFALKIAEILKYITEIGMRHCDIKPENIFVSFPKSLDMIEIDRADIKLGDFNISTVYEDNLTELGLKSVRGTFSYMAPELLKAHLDHEIITFSRQKADVYSFGIVLLEIKFGDRLRIDTNDIIAGRQQSIDSLIDQVESLVFRDLLKKMLALSAENRPKFGSLFKDMKRLRNILKNQETSSIVTQ